MAESKSQVQNFKEFVRDRERYDEKNFDERLNKLVKHKPVEKAA